ncbi:MAG: hypothetical protein QOE22_577 [Candidatus Parcubacteria bacterium]|jgi:hypothetical protein|nr:hypothetical protein [Candidatus Parcubacteria bacterium]
MYPYYLYLWALALSALSMRFLGEVRWHTFVIFAALLLANAALLHLWLQWDWIANLIIIAVVAFLLMLGREAGRTNLG